MNEQNLNRLDKNLKIYASNELFARKMVEDKSLIDNQREIFLNQNSGTGMFSTYNNKIKECAANYRNDASNFGDTINNISKILLEMSGINNLVANPSQISHSLIDSYVNDIYQILNQNDSTIKINKSSLKHDEIASRNFDKINRNELISEFISLVSKFQSSFTTKDSVSCSDLSFIKALSNLFNFENIENSKLKNQQLRIALLIHMLANSQSTLTNSMNNILITMEEFLESPNITVNDLINDKRLLNIYLLCLSQYIQLCVGGSISVASLGKKTIKYASELISQVILKSKNSDIEDILNSQLSQDVCCLGSFSCLFSSMFGMRIKTEGGINSAADSAISISYIIDKIITKIDNMPNDKILSSNITGLAQFGILCTTPKLTDIKELSQQIRVPQNKAEEFVKLVADVVGELVNVVQTKSSILFNVNAVEGHNVDEILSKYSSNIKHSRELHLTETEYNKLSSIFNNQLDLLLDSNDTSQIISYCRALSKLRQHICETDSINKNRIIYGFDDSMIKICGEKIIQKLSSNQLPEKQNMDLVQSVALLITIMHSKYRNKPTINEFINKEDIAKHLIKKLTSNIPLMSIEAKKQTKKFAEYLFIILTHFSNSDRVIDHDSFMYSSKELLKLSMVLSLYDLKNTIVSFGSSEKIEMYSSKSIHELCENIRHYFRCFVYNENTKISKLALHHLLDEIFLSRGHVVNNVLQAVMKITFLSLIIKNTLEEDEMIITPSKQELLDFIQNEILHSISNEVIKSSNKGNENFNTANLKKNTIEFLIMSLKNILLSNPVAKENNISSSASGILYLASRLLDERDIPDVETINSYISTFANRYQKGTEHQNGDCCLTTTKLEKMAIDIKNLSR